MSVGEGVEMTRGRRGCRGSEGRLDRNSHGGVNGKMVDTRSD